MEKTNPKGSRLVAKKTKCQRQSQAAPPSRLQQGQNSLQKGMKRGFKQRVNRDLNLRLVSGWKKRQKEKGKMDKKRVKKDLKLRLVFG